METASQAGLVFGLGCSYAQGYHFARPAPAEEIDAMLAADKLPSGRAAE